MSREVRPVALDWEHPRGRGTYQDGSPRYIGLSSREDLNHRLGYRADHPGDEDEQEPIDLSEYMPEIREGTPCGWQMYETVSDGTPLSPVFATKDELAAWLASPEAGDEQRSPAVAARFVEEGWAPTFASSGGQFMSGVDWIGRT
jgi:hypothetical protein